MTRLSILVGPFPFTAAAVRQQGVEVGPIYDWATWREETFEGDDEPVPSTYVQVGKTATATCYSPFTATGRLTDARLTYPYSGRYPVV